MNETTPRITTGEGTTDDKETGTSDATRREGIFVEKSVGKQPENTAKGQTQTPRGQHRKTEETRREISTTQIGNMNKGGSSGNRKVHCYYYWKDGHYSNQCPVKSNEKQPAVNMVIAEVTDVQQVTTRSKGKAAEWETQETIQKQAMEWIKNANERNVAKIQEQNAQPEEPVKHTVIVKGKEITGIIIDGGSGVNVISKRTSDTLGIRDWELCPFWLRMADTSLVRLTGLIRDLDVTIGGHAFQISTVVL